MPDPTKISLSERWQYECRAFNKAKSEIGWTALFISFGGAMLSGGFAWAMGWKNSHDAMVIFLSTVFGLVGSFTILFLVKLLAAPAKMAKEAQEKLDSQKTAFDSEKARLTSEIGLQQKTHSEEKERLEKTIESLRAPANSSLEIEVVNPVGRDILTSRSTYRIKVKTTHTSKVVKNLKVWLFEIEWPQQVQKPLIWRWIIFPYRLPEKGSQNNLAVHELAAGIEMEFDLMFVDMSQFKRTINLAPFLPKNVGSPSIFKSVVSDISFNIDILPHNDSKLIFKFKITGGDGDVDTVSAPFVLQIPPLLLEHNTFDQIENINALMKEPEKYLPLFEKFPALKITAELSKFLEELNARRYSIEFMHDLAYETEWRNDGDKKTTQLLHRIFDFILKHFGETECRLFKSDASFPRATPNPICPNKQNTLTCIREYGKRLEGMIRNQQPHKPIENKGENKS